VQITSGPTADRARRLITREAFLACGHHKKSRGGSTLYYAYLTCGAPGMPRPFEIRSSDAPHQEAVARTLQNEARTGFGTTTPLKPDRLTLMAKTHEMREDRHASCVWQRFQKDQP